MITQRRCEWNLGRDELRWKVNDWRRRVVIRLFFSTAALIAEDWRARLTGCARRTNHSTQFENIPDVFIKKMLVYLKAAWSHVSCRQTLKCQRYTCSHGYIGEVLMVRRLMDDHDNTYLGNEALCSGMDVRTCNGKVRLQPPQKPRGTGRGRHCKVGTSAATLQKFMETRSFLENSPTYWCRFKSHGW